MFGLAFESALRSIIKTPGVSALVIMAIALGVGITMPMVTLYHNNSGDPLPEVSHKLYRVLIDNWHLDQNFWDRHPSMPPDVLNGRDTRALTSSDIPTRYAASYSTNQYVRSVDNSSAIKPFFAAVRITSHGFFDMFQVPIAYGNFWDAKADLAVNNVAVISYSTNLRLFGGGDNVGSNFKLGSKIYTVIGITGNWALTPRVYDMSQNNARPEGVFVPLSNFKRRHLKPDMRWKVSNNSSIEFDSAFLSSEKIFAILWVQLDSPEQRDEYLDFINSYVAEQKSLGRFPRPMNNRLYSAAEWVEVSPSNQGTQGLYKVFIVVGVFFLLVCLFNLLSLLLSKFMSVTPQACIVRALGATRGMIFSQYVIEVMLLGIVGGILSVFVAMAALEAMLWVYLENLPAEFKQVQSQAGSENAYVQFDTSLLLATIGLSLVASLLSALYPAWRACRIAPAEYLKMN